LSPYLPRHRFSIRDARDVSLLAFVKTN
jgi:hypothetical protein